MTKTGIPAGLIADLGEILPLCRNVQKILNGCRYITESDALHVTAQDRLEKLVKFGARYYVQPEINDADRRIVRAANAFFEQICVKHHRLSRVVSLYQSKPFMYEGQPFAV